MKDKDIIILFYNTMFNFPLNFNDKDIPEGFTLTTNRDLLPIADAVVFHLPDLYKSMDRDEISKPEGQIWISWSLESEENYLWTKESEFRELFDLNMGYHLKDDILYTYYDSLTAEDFKKKFSINSKKDKTCMFISSPFNKSKRFEYIKELMSFTPIDSYGRIMHNCDLTEDDKGVETLKKTISQYKFCIGFENAISQDYVTEKFFNPLISGTVPIYLGAPNIHDFAPGENCFIDVTSFESPKSLGEFVNKCYNDNKLYTKFFEWKDKPLRTEFQEKLNAVKESPFKRLCHKIRDIKISNK